MHVKRYFPTPTERQVQYAVEEISLLDVPDACNLCFFNLGKIQKMLAEGMTAKDIAVDLHFRHVLQVTASQEARIRELLSTKEGDFYENLAKLHFLDYEHLLER